MTAEQLLNWICCAVSYVLVSGDMHWLQHRRQVLQECFTSLLNRDDPDPSKRDGVNSLDSTRCQGGWEITTYDSLDPSLVSRGEMPIWRLRVGRAIVGWP